MTKKQLSSVHNPERVQTAKQDEEGNLIRKLNLVVDCNSAMRGIDRLNQYLHDY